MTRDVSHVEQQLPGTEVDFHAIVLQMSYPRTKSEAVPLMGSEGLNVSDQRGHCPWSPVPQLLSCFPIGNIIATV